ncbi:MAG: gliding motility-associated C-terminal domain-containing protein [Bacteroidota bacterium]
MINQKYILQLLFLFCVCVLNAQIESNPPMRQVLASTGGTGSFNGNTMDYTVGECMITTYSGIPSVVHALTQGFQQPFTVSDTIPKKISPLKFYSGITPNGDGENDLWEIDGITAFPENTVTIFNRWGEKVWNGNNYDNVKTVWDGKNGADLLPDATYFYVVELDKKIYKGWVELTK